jgi:hypothetical protein
MDDEISSTTRKNALKKKKRLEETLAKEPSCDKLYLTCDIKKRSEDLKRLDRLILEIRVYDADITERNKEIEDSRQSVINSKSSQYKSKQNKTKQQEINTKRKHDNEKRELDDKIAMCEQRKANHLSSNMVLTKQSPYEKRQEKKREEQNKLRLERQAKNIDKKRLDSAKKHSREYFMKRHFQIFKCGYRNEKNLTDERIHTLKKQRMVTVTRGYFQEWKLVHGDKAKNERIANRTTRIWEIIKKRNFFTNWKNIVEEMILLIPFLIVKANEKFEQRVFDTFLRGCRDAIKVRLEQFETLQLKRHRAILKGYFHELKINYRSSQLEFKKSGQEFFSIWKHFKTHTFTCVICCSDKDLRKTTFSQLECKHLYCADCITDMYPTSKECPQCRKCINELPEAKRFNEKSRKMVTVDIEIEKRIFSENTLNWEKIIESWEADYGCVNIKYFWDKYFWNTRHIYKIDMFYYILDHPYCITNEYKLELEERNRERAEDEVQKQHQLKLERERRERLEYQTVQNYTIDEFTQNDINGDPMYTPNEIHQVRELLSYNPLCTTDGLMAYEIMCPRVRLLENRQREEFRQQQSQQQSQQAD